MLPLVVGGYLHYRKQTKAGAKDKLNETAAAMAQTKTTTYSNVVHEVSSTSLSPPASAAAGAIPGGGSRDYRRTCVGVELSAGHQAPAPPETTRPRVGHDAPATSRASSQADDGAVPPPMTWREWFVERTVGTADTDRG